jgi:hypothetical protein
MMICVLDESSLDSLCQIVNVAIVQVLFQTLEVLLDGAQVWHASSLIIRRQNMEMPMYSFKVMCVDVGWQPDV